MDQRFSAKRHRDIKRATDIRTKKVRRCHTNDCEGQTVKRQRAADGFLRPRKASLPEAVANHGHGTMWAAARLVVCIGERAPKEGGHAQDVEERTVRPKSIDELRLTAR